jgi:hypothetical protein
MPHRYTGFNGYDIEQHDGEERSVHPYLLESLNAQHRHDLQRTAAPRRARRPLRRPLPVACGPARPRVLARVLHLHPAPTLAH